jgi:hemoglobin-like flavoprotein
MTVTEDEILQFHASLDRASANPVFLDAFYDSFMSSSGDIAGYFEHTDMGRLKRKLKSSLHMMTLLVDESPGVDMYVAHLSRVHDSYRIPAALYQVWLDTLIEAVQRCDPLFDRNLESIWRHVLSRGIAIMAAGVGSHASPMPSVS